MLKQIESYQHRNATIGFTQEPDSQPGPYYVSVENNGSYRLLSGPYDTHSEALSRVSLARRVSERHDAKAVWYGFGTTRMKPDYNKPGILQQWGYAMFGWASIKTVSKAKVQ